MSLLVNAASFARALKAVDHARAKDEMRPILTGILLSARKGKVYAVAADNYRLAECEIRLFEEEGNDPAFLGERTTIIASDGLKLVRTFLASLPKSNVPYNITIDVRGPAGGRRALMLGWSGGLAIDVPLIDGTYPPYYSVIPTKSTRAWTVNPRYLKEAASAAGECAKDTGHVALRWSGPLHPVLLTTREGYREAIMPVRTPEDGDRPAMRPVVAKFDPTPAAVDAAVEAAAVATDHHELGGEA